MEELASGIWFRFTVAALATWRLSFLVAREDGPWHLFAGLRRVAGRVSLGQALGCVKCMSVWFAAPFAWFVGGGPAQIIVIWLGLSGVSALIDEWTKPPFEWREDSGDELLRRDANGAADSAAPDEG